VLFERIESYYGRGINWALGNRKKVVLMTAGSIVLGLLILPITGMEFMPEQDDGRLIFKVQFPVGTNLQTTETMITRIEQKLQTVVKPEEYRVIRSQAGYGKGFAAAFGGNTDHSAQIEIRLVPIGQRDRSVSELRTAVREALADIPGAEINYNVQSGGFGGAAQIAVKSMVMISKSRRNLLKRSAPPSRTFRHQGYFGVA
jgi:HAE1 family hydrophobic/amphiphilic exporter-1